MLIQVNRPIASEGIKTKRKPNGKKSNKKPKIQTTKEHLREFSRKLESLELQVWQTLPGECTVFYGEKKKSGCLFAVTKSSTAF